MTKLVPGNRTRIVLTVAGAAALLSSALVSTAAHGQGRAVTVRGIAYDSLRAEALEGAVISVIGTGKTTISDRRGRFEFEDVAPGTYTFTMNHGALDSLGLTGVSSQIEVTNGREDVRLAVPGFSAFWSVACATAPPKDSILVYGAVRHPADQTPVPMAKVELAWLDLGVKGRREVTQQAQTLSTTTDSTGAFGFCGVPKGAGLRIRAVTDDAASGIIDLPPDDSRVRWRDLTIGQYLMLDSTQVGTISGVVMRGTGTPLAGARIVMDEAPEAHTDDDGRFTIRGVPAGTRQLQVLAVGTNELSRVVDVRVNRTTELVIFTEAVTTLAAVRVTGSAFIRHMAEGLTERRKLSFGSFLDSTDFTGQGPVRSVFEGIAGLAVRAMNREYVLVLKESAVRECPANIFIDGIRQMDQERLWTFRREDIKAVEIYKRGSLVPPEFQVLRSTCGSVAVWTRSVFP
ncbi:MAG: carboxypeptidase regulatory-like domain-containing protein [Gemmatimonadetes bacterium]|nr:carboxypeptidase regulatory-like domain-containing protein [Gemmatimonadota bacterium]